MPVKEAPPMRVNEGDRVYLRADSDQALGTVMSIEHGFGFIVTWDTGRTWLYPMCDLEVA